MKKFVGFIFIIIFFGFRIFKASSYQFTLLEIGELDTGWSTVDVYVNDDILYALDSSLGLKIYNISDPTTPKELGSFHNSYTFSHAFYYKNGLILIADYNNKLEIVNVSNPMDPRLIGHFYDKDDTLEHVGATNLHNMGNYVFIASQYEGVEIIDIEDPTNPVKIGRYYFGRSINVVYASNNLVFIREMGGAFKILDITNLTHPIEIYHCTEVNTGQNFFLMDNNLLYVPDLDFGLRIYDITDPSNTIKKGEKQIDGRSMKCVIEERGSKIFAYITAEEDGLIVLDVTDPENIEEVASYNDGGKSFSLFIQNDLVFVAEFLQGLEILQISVDNDNPSSSTPGFEFLFVFGGLISLIVVIRKENS
ncbi:MAG: LVIVD repeat-containing protein [Candidatus Hodarchaeales archaeon]|jgi:hypothetical protein